MLLLCKAFGRSNEEDEEPDVEGSVSIVVLGLRWMLRLEVSYKPFHQLMSPSPTNIKSILYVYTCSTLWD